MPVRGRLDVITADATLAAAEVWLARRDQDRDRGAVESHGPGAPSLSIRDFGLRAVAVALNQNADLCRRSADSGFV